MPHLRQEQLSDFLTQGCRPRSDWRLGIEYEQFVVDPQGRPVPYAGTGGVQELLQILAQRTGWEEIVENGHLFGMVAPDGRSITIEPGAQIEFGSTPCSSLKQAASEIADYVALLDELKTQRNVHFLALGAQPMARPEQIQRIPKNRYDILEPYLQNSGDLGLWMMKATCGVQINFDYSDEEDAMRKMRTLFALSPLLSALFANSSVRAGEVSGFASWRGHVWSRTDPARCGLVKSLMQPQSTFEDYVNWAQDLSMLFIQRNGDYVDMRGKTFRQHLQSGQATKEDWELHLSTPFPEARFRPQLELRCTDTLCPNLTLGLAALIQGIFYEESALEQAWALVKDWSFDELQASWHAAHRHGLAAPLPESQQSLSRRTFLDLAKDLVDLCVLSPEDSLFLSPVLQLLEVGASEGETAAALFAGEWQGSAERLLDFASCSEIGSSAPLRP